MAETTGVQARHLRKLPKFFVTLTTRLVGWNGIQAPDSVIRIQRRIADEFWSELKISLGTEATYEDDHVVDDGR